MAKNCWECGKELAASTGAGIEIPLCVTCEMEKRDQHGDQR